MSQGNLIYYLFLLTFIFILEGTSENIRSQFIKIIIKIWEVTERSNFLNLKLIIIIQQIFVEYLLCAKPWKYKDKQNTHFSVFKEWESSLVGDQDESINSNAR